MQKQFVEAPRPEVSPVDDLGCLKIKSCAAVWEFLSNPGSVKQGCEQHFTVAGYSAGVGVVGVISGTPEIFHPNPQSPDCQKSFGARHSFRRTTGAQEVAKVIQPIMTESAMSHDLLDNLRHCNFEAANRLVDLDYDPTGAAAYLPGVSGAFARIPAYEEALGNPNAKIQIAAWGNARAFVALRDGSHWISEDKSAAFTARAAALFEGCIKEVTRNGTVGRSEKSRNMAWDKYIPEYRHLADQRINRPDHEEGYLMMNGQDAFDKHIKGQEFSYEDVQFVLLFTDGMIVNKTEAGKPELFIPRLMKAYAAQPTSVYDQSILGRMRDSTFDALAAVGGTWETRPEMAACHVPLNDLKKELLSLWPK